MEFVNVGFGNFVTVKKIMAIVSPDSAPIRKLIQDAKKDNRLINATYGRKTRSVLIMVEDKVILSAVQPETVANRINISLANNSLSEVNDDEK